jgi:DNA-binding CsgD family transcriptional regulator
MGSIAITPGRTLGAAIGAVALFNTLSALTVPVPMRRPAAVGVFLALLLLLLHATLYWLGERVRRRFDLRVYAAAQAMVLLAIIIVSRLPGPVSLGLLMAGTAEMVVLARGRWGPVPITVAAVALYLAAAFGTAGLYGAATAGLLIAVAGTMAHALAVLVQRPANTPSAAPLPDAVPIGARGRWDDLSPRESEVLRELLTGARNIEIAARLGISERTVKAHLAHIYQKLGVDSRAAAIAAALTRRLT